MKKMNNKEKEAETKLLTETELELMTILWKLSEGSVADPPGFHSFSKQQNRFRGREYLAKNEIPFYGLHCPQ